MPIDPQITRSAAAITGLLGAVFHVVPDAIMHPDVRPFAPFTDANPFFNLVAVGLLHLTLVVVGAVGLGLLALQRRRI